MERDEPPRSIQAVERTCEIIGAIEREGTMGITELAEELGITKGTVHTHLATLSREGLVTQSDEGYQLGLRPISLAERVKERIEIYDLVASELEKLADMTGERTQFALLEGAKAVVVHRVEGENAIKTTSPVGRYVDPHCISVGLAMMAHLPERRVEEIVDKSGLPRRTENTVTDPETLRRRLEEVRERGYAVDDEERVRGVRCIGAPLRDDEGGVLGGISISGPARRITDDKIETELKDELLRTANVIEVNAELS
ncbi:MULTISPECIES: IclR family transcriptional regulator [Halorussus]|uniref:IclR family transcriptional regulator n=1 Tax=Halorussus TaxID=1070314 RepID=UPI000E210959|nr:MULTISPECIES: IclR family transcriptional regulator [Halorussus]NHN61664.1 IclR family transcriptional regulator [Halorussus sp. JP-T4]